MKHLFAIQIQLFLCSLLTTGCHMLPETPVQLPAGTGHRALGSYQWDEIAQLRQQQLQARKIVRINGQADSVMVKDSTGLAALFRPLMDADISNPSLADAYKTDTIANQFSNDTTFIIRSLGKQTWPYQLILDVDSSGRIKTAQVTSHTSNLMYDYKQDIFYERHKALRVTTFQQIIFLKPENMEVETYFYPSTPRI
ncbi:hypothetical protein [Chitinophaga cymbidii]|uniref:Lipoprotein n=1 Tax=Chitinophaga cymbidii TaxID=1096750 RepID=A0A512RI25_9BACT|nr:hypothetical protein [Chitinophaga cymbidii]GEP95345.1 hypothetical protein CCY01nite_16050 [Chitinophaga cymbidii]